MPESDESLKEVVMSFRTTPEIAVRISNLADEKRRSRSSLIEEALKDYLDDETKVPVIVRGNANHWSDTEITPIPMSPEQWSASKDPFDQLLQTRSVFPEEVHAWLEEQKYLPITFINDKDRFRVIKPDFMSDEKVHAANVEAWKDRPCSNGVHGVRTCLCATLDDHTKAAIRYAMSNTSLAESEAAQTIGGSGDSAPGA